MKFQFDGDSVVSSPMYMGSQRQVRAMQACSHPAFLVDAGDGTALPGAPHCRVGTERCQACGAVRTRVTGPRDELLNAFELSEEPE